ncbi:hypothetical protein [Jeotgalibaca sp. A127]|uniref:hypothetical protein n=1 Tax=Jeotgalibaca sp. A127 TaxID=3457324 RepID=UPI003FD25C83
MMETKRRLLVLAVMELVLMTLAVLYDFLMPTIVVSAIGALFIFLRKEKFANMGFKRQQDFPKMLLGIFGMAFGWSFVNFGFFLPVLNKVWRVS